MAEQLFVALDERKIADLGLPADAVVKDVWLALLAAEHKRKAAAASPEAQDDLARHARDAAELINAAAHPAVRVAELGLPQDASIGDMLVALAYRAATTAWAASKTPWPRG